MKRLLLALLLTATALAQPPTPPAPQPAPETKNATLTRLAEDFTVRARVARNLARIIGTREAAVAFNLSAESYERAALLCRQAIDPKPAECVEAPEVAASNSDAAEVAQ